MKPSHTVRTLALAIAAALAPAAPAAAQAGDTACAPLPRPGAERVADDFDRLLGITGARPLGSAIIRRGSQLRSPACAGARDPLGPDWYADAPAERLLVLPVRARSAFNSAWPRDANNGALWAGRGVAAGVEAGVHLRAGPVTAALAPGFYYHQNRSFSHPAPAFPGLASFAYPWHAGTIDWPQRRGDDAYARLDAGQSFLRVDAYGLALGASNENLWWGPALHDPLIFSNTGPGFPHVFFGTAAPLDVRIGNLEGEVIWGVVRESDWFDADPDNDRRLLAALIAHFEPRGLDGLFLGAARAFMTTIPPDGFSVADYLLEPYRGVRENPPAGTTGDNQIIALFGRWALPRSGFEVYAEWARDDHWEDLEDLIKEPDHAQVYTLGLQKVVEFARAGAPAHRWLRLYGELTHLEGALPLRSGRGVVTFYTNASVPQGFTHDGQLLGAAIGPGSDTQIVGADLFDGRGRIGLFAQRVRHDDDAYYANFARFYGQHGHDVELTAGARQLLMLGDLDIDWELTWSHRYNRHFDGLDAANFDALFTESNVGLRLELGWRPRLRARAD